MGSGRSAGSIPPVPPLPTRINFERAAALKRAPACQIRGSVGASCRSAENRARAFSLSQTFPLGATKRYCLRVECIRETCRAMGKRPLSYARPETQKGWSRLRARPFAFFVERTKLTPERNGQIKTKRADPRGPALCALHALFQIADSRGCCFIRRRIRTRRVCLPSQKASRRAWRSSVASASARQ